MNFQLFVGDFIWALFFRGSIVVAVAAIAVLLFRRHPAASRHAVWLACVCALAALPLTALRLPTWSVPKERIPAMVPLATPTLLKTTPVHRVHPIEPIEARSLPSRPQEIPERQPMDLATIVGIAWLVGFGAVCLRLSLGLLQVGWIVRSGRPYAAEGQYLPAWMSGVKVRICRRLQMPSTAGCFRPVILLPEEALNWSRDRLIAVLAHEVAHVRRRDWLWQLVGQFVCAIHFANPLAWAATKRMRMESEKACDDFVLEVGVEPESYAEELLGIAKSARFALAGAVSMTPSERIGTRLASILDPRRRRSKMSRKPVSWALAGCVLLTIPLLTLRVRAGLAPHSPGGHRKYWSELPQIPWVKSQQVEPNVFLAANGVAGLPDGTRVKLIGVADNENATDSWGIDGLRLADADEWQRGAKYSQGRTFHMFQIVMDAMTPMERSFLVELESPTNKTISFTSKVVRPATLKNNSLFAVGRDVQIPDVNLEANHAAYGVVPIWIPSKANDGDYRVGVASGEWRTVATLDHPFGETPALTSSAAYIDEVRIELGDQPHPSIEYTDTQLEKHSVLLMPPGHIDPAEARRVVAYDDQGGEVELPDAISDGQGYPRYVVLNETARRIAKIELQTAPYHWVEFRSVPFKPNFREELARRLNPGLTGTAAGVAPGFTKALPLGATVSLNSVMGSKLDRGDWRFEGQPAWRGDGRILAKAPSWRHGPIPVKFFGNRPAINYSIEFHNLADDADTIAIPTGDIDPSCEQYFSPPFGHSQQTLAIASYLSGATSGGLKVGVAQGPWKVLSTTPIRRAALASDRSSGSPDSFQGISVTIGATAVLRDSETNNALGLAGKEIQALDRELIAVLKSGKSKVIPVTAMGANCLEVYDFPTRRSENAPDEILAGDIAELRLEARPYTWVEFKGIALKPRG